MELANCDELEEVDCNWIDNYTDLRHNIVGYDNYSSHPIRNITITAIYVNHLDVIVKIQKTNRRLENDSVLTKEELLAVIKNNQIFGNTRYRFMNIIVFNIDINSGNLGQFMQTPNEELGSRYTSISRSIDDIKYKNSALVLQDINNLTIVYRATPSSIKSATKKHRRAMHRTTRSSRRFSE